MKAGDFLLPILLHFLQLAQDLSSVH